MARSLTAAAILAALALTSGCADDAEPTTATSPQVAATASPSFARSTPSATTSATSNGSRFTLVATGDVLLHPALWEQARRDAKDASGAAMDFRPMLAAVRPRIADADLAVCHLETPLAGRSGPFKGYPLFSGPPQIAPALAASGYDACTTASNHTFDQGAAGVKRTLDVLDDAGIAHAGSARNQGESRRITMLEADDAQVALLSYTYGFNGVDYPSGQRWRANVIDEKTILVDAARARKAGADVVVLAMHWGTEYQHEPSAQQKRMAPRLARSGAVDLILGHHAHVVEPIQRLGRTWVVYGLGNFVAHHATPGPANAEGLLARFTFEREGSGRYRVAKAEYVPLLMTRSAPIRLLDVPAALGSGEYGSTTKTRLRQALSRTTRVVESMGGSDDGLVRIGS